MGKRFKVEEIVMKLREVEFTMNKGPDVAQACRQAVVPIRYTYNTPINNPVSPQDCNLTG